MKSKTKKPEISEGTRLLVKVVNHIIAHPETWDQSAWHCRTTHCVAGHGQIMAGKPPNSDTAMRDAREAFGLCEGDANYLFSGMRTLPQIYMFTKSKLGPFDRASFDRAGFDRAGKKLKIGPIKI